MTTLGTGPARMTPSQIDQRLAELYRDASRAEQSLAAANVGLHHALGEREPHTGRGRRYWPTSDAQALELVRAKAADPQYAEVPWGCSPVKAVAAYDRAVGQVAGIDAQAAPLNDEFTRRGGWSRFFVVPGGHIHSSMSCQTCNRDGKATSFGWNPELSGLTEADAVAKLGPSLCTVCFPSAPVEWTVGAPEKPSCPGSGLAPEGKQRRSGMRWYGNCPTCHEAQPVNGTGGVRKHPPVGTSAQAGPVKAVTR